MTKPASDITFAEYCTLTARFLQAPGGLILPGGVFNPCDSSTVMAERLADIDEAHPDYEDRLPEPPD